MPTQVIPRPSILYETKPAKDVDSRLMAARYAVAGDTEDEAAGYAATPGLEDKVRQLEDSRLLLLILENTRSVCKSEDHLLVQLMYPLVPPKEMEPGGL